MAPRMVSVGSTSDAIIFRSFTKMRLAFDCRSVSSEISGLVRAGTRAPVDSGGVGVRGGIGAIFTTCCEPPTAAQWRQLHRPSVRETHELVNEGFGRWRTGAPPVVDGFVKRRAGRP